MRAARGELLVRVARMPCKKGEGKALPQSARMKGTHIVKGATTAKNKRGKTLPLFKVQVWNWFSLNISFCCGVVCQVFWEERG